MFDSHASTTPHMWFVISFFMLLDLSIDFASNSMIWLAMPATASDGCISRSIERSLASHTLLTFLLNERAPRWKPRFRSGARPDWPFPTWPRWLALMRGVFRRPTRPDSLHWNAKRQWSRPTALFVRYYQRLLRLSLEEAKEQRDFVDSRRIKEIRLWAPGEGIL